MVKKLIGFLTAFVLLGSSAWAQGANISGTVTDENGDALPGVNVVIEELVLGAASNAEGRYSFTVPGASVNGQQVTLSAKFVGFTPYSQQITLSPGTSVFDIVLGDDVLNLDEVVVTGVSAETPQKKLAFDVDKVSAAQLELAPASNPVGSMQGKVAGAQVVQNSGAPGDGLSVRLRGSTSITGSNAPLYIVDGVILGANQVDMDALDIESMEIVKGAAASSLYGSRAQNGVIQITTKRGTTEAFGQTRITIRNEYGTNSLENNLETNLSHNFVVDGSGNFLDADGAVIPYGPGVQVNKNEQGASFFDTPYTGTLYNAFDAFFDPGDTYTNHVAISQNNAKTNFHASFTNLSESGIILGQKGYDRQSVRLNLDHRAFANLNVSASAFYSQSTRDNPASTDFNPFFGLMFTSPVANLAARDENGNLIVQADPLAVEENPLYLIENADIKLDRSRVLGSFRTRYTPLDFLELEAGASYDRSDRDNAEFYDRGYETIDPGSINDGRINRSNAVSEALNYDVTASFRREFGDLTSRVQLKYQGESSDAFSEAVRGETLTSSGIADLSNVDGEKTVSSFFSTVKSDGFYATATLDYADRYIFDILGRRDGSSLFGEDERWQNYYRLSGAWRISEEGFWPLRDAVPEFKLRASLGTAGGRPSFEAQYETFTLNSGVLSKGTLGNSTLKPELQTELELGVEMSLFDRVFAELVWADSRIEDQLVQVPLAGYFGFASQWRNAGTIESNTIEASLDATLLRTRNTTLNMGFVFDKTVQEISEFDSNPYRNGPRNVFYVREGEVFGTMYGERWANDFADLDVIGLGGFKDQFQINDDGYLVWVGSGNSFQDGITKSLWGTGTAEALAGSDGNSYGFDWGIPFAATEKITDQFGDEQTTQFIEVGDVLPDYNLGWTTTLRVGGLTAHMLWNAQVGGDVYNFTKQWSYRDGRAADQDQAGKSDALKKSQSYYEKLYQATGTNSHFVEDGTYVKLREVSLGYSLERDFLRQFFGNALNRVSISVIGRNMLTLFSDYSGFDPEVGDSGSSNGDATLYRVDNFNYPKFRSVRGMIEIQF